VTDALAALVLAAGEGKRLRPLTTLRPKPLCPVAGTTLLDLAMERVRDVVPDDAIAVNAHHLFQQVVDHVGNRAHVAVEQPEALGTAGAVGALRGWLDGRDVLVANGDVCFDRRIDVIAFVGQWDRERPRLLVVADPERADFDGGWRFAGLSLLPGRIAAGLVAEPSGLYEAVWRSAELDLVPVEARYVDCADPSSYLSANLMLSGGVSVVAPDAIVEGTIDRCVVWPGARVHAGESLVQVVRARDAEGRDLTVPAPQR
jgi:molybdopterin-guanine dinucleotide biosynthesis protein A